MCGPREAQCSPCRRDRWGPVGTPWPDGSLGSGRPRVRGDATPVPGLENRLPAGQGPGRAALGGRTLGPGVNTPSNAHLGLWDPDTALATRGHRLPRPPPLLTPRDPHAVQRPPRRDSSPPGTTEKLPSSRPQAGNKGRELSTWIHWWAALPPGTSTPNPAMSE